MGAREVENSKIMKKILIFCAIVAAITALALYWVKSREEAALQREESAKDAEKTKELEQKILSFSIDGRTPKGVRQWHLEGTSAEIVDDEIHFNDLEATAYGEGTTVNLTSDTGIYRKDKGEVILIGNVRVKSGDGSLLLTHRAKWSQETREISSDVTVRIERENMIAIGKGGLANSAEKKAMLKKDVRVEIKPDTTVSSDGPLMVNNNDNIAIFHDNVKVKDKDGKLFADKLTVHLDPETQKISKVVAEGNVKVKRRKSYTMSDKAVYTESTKSAKLTGNPRVIIDPEELAELEGLEAVGGK
jgi:LPS export ABC transporter protein LptC/lipopolysaccharide transport protein LptA